jgi:DNA ligase-1
MPDLADGEVFYMQGSGSKPYELKNVGGVYSCTCPAWRNQSTPIERRTCKHLRKLRGEAAEEARLGGEGGVQLAPASRLPNERRGIIDRDPLGASLAGALLQVLGSP